MELGSFRMAEQQNFDISAIVGSGRIIPSICSVLLVIGSTAFGVDIVSLASQGVH